MKILVISPDKSDIANVRCYTDVWSHYLCRELEARGVELVYSPMMDGAGLSSQEAVEYHRALPLMGADHILALGLRYFSRFPNEVARVLRSRISGALTQFHDHYIASPNGVDALFHVVKSAAATGAKLGVGNGVHIGWAADEMICCPHQSLMELTLLIDHPYYGNVDQDWSRNILLDAQRFVLSGDWQSRWENVRVRRIIDGGVEDVSIVERDVPAFHRRHVSFARIVQDYSTAHVFLPTHREAVGLSVLELALCGALIVVPQGFIPRDRLATVRSLTYTATIPWDEVLKRIDIKASRAMAMGNSWDAVGWKVWEFFRDFKRPQ